MPQPCPETGRISSMRVVALEEHFTVPALASKYVKPEAVAKRGHFKGRNVAPGKASPMELLPEVGAMIHGTTEGRFLDHPGYDGLLAAAVELDVPIYIHPNVPSMDVRQAYYSNLPEGSDRVVATAGWGWHSEVAIHILRMVFAGTFDKHPKLKMIIGHMGEMLPVMLARIDEVSAADAGHLKRKPSQTIVEQVWITT